MDVGDAHLAAVENPAESRHGLARRNEQEIRTCEHEQPAPDRQRVAADALGPLFRLTRFALAFRGALLPPSFGAVGRSGGESTGVSAIAHPSNLGRRTRYPPPRRSPLSTHASDHRTPTNNRQRRSTTGSRPRGAHTMAPPADTGHSG